ncbi:multiple inositol polyphosphate phosphatase 1 [Nasonia vitripennis]|uniref:Multiple inositol polyphosphate phosphatase 1 n=1 Tax=Nasonia vitripennis TaxID=7425 RepID=A0A7M7IMA6_NASVI|nr:multiple inositol polyphosphate phosphatase 1 [Nasonia vitripennis]XP_016837276.1 multiple inositol polyphosphate phosphatase 1 [Nasonia vitripennis]
MLGASIAILLASVALVQPAAVDQERTCYDPRRDLYPYFSTRTAYERVHGNVSRAESSCVPMQIWVLSRHGTRYPGKKVVPQLLALPAMRDQIVKNHEKGDGRLCDEDLQKLKNWKPDRNINNAMADLLAPQGEDDLQFLAQRLQRAFPELLQVDARNVQPDDYVFRSTDTQRTKESLKSFARGLFGRSEVARVMNIPVNDTLLQPNKHCPAWDKSYDPILTNVERDKFTSGPEIRSLIQGVSQRLGYDRPLDFEKTIKSIYEMCRFESAWYVNRTSVWCSVFNKEELKIMEYREDLNYYYCCGPGREISAKVGCPLLSDMFQHFKRLASGSTNEPKGVFYFAHTMTLQTFLSALKIGYEPQPPLASNYASSANRKYRTSILGPFATNVVAVFYRCNGAKPTNKVTFHVAERLTPLVSCNEDGTCDWESLEREFEDQVNSCDMEFCNKKPTDEEEMTTTTEIPTTTTMPGNETDASDSAAERTSEQILTLTIAMIFVSTIMNGL